MIQNIHIIGNSLPEGDFYLHSRFKRVSNFQNAANEIVFITNEPTNCAANGIYIIDNKLDEIKSIHINETSIRLNEFTIQRSECNLYDAKIDFGQSRFDNLENWLLAIPSTYLSIFPRMSLVVLLQPENEQYFTSTFDAIFLKNAKNALASMLSGEVLAGIKTIKGTGYGLTPSGDDFIAGLLLGSFFTEKKQHTDLSRFRSEIIKLAKSSNNLTNSFIYNASKGFFHQAFKNFLYLYPEIFEQEIRLKSLLSHGE
ncbi:MAG: DUF2877 domain-containing protein, partial [Ignavibacteria bacterium]|nr:DUF2877 domain-containing protein [Ignavibacteria bacterium]